MLTLLLAYAAEQLNSGITPVNYWYVTTTQNSLFFRILFLTNSLIGFKRCDLKFPSYSLVHEL